MIDQEQQLNTQTNNNYPLYATFWQRLGASLIDSLILGFAIIIIMGIYVGLAYLLTNSASETAIGIAMGLGFLMYIALAIIGPLYYYKYFYSKQGATIGKNVFKIKVLNRDNHEYLGWKGVFLREIFGKAASQMVFYIGGFTCIFANKERQAVHDHFANTIVVQTNGTDIVYTDKPAEVSHTKALLTPIILISLFYIAYFSFIALSIFSAGQDPFNPDTLNGVNFDDNYNYEPYNIDLDNTDINITNDELDNILNNLNTEVIN